MSDRAGRAVRGRAALTLAVLAAMAIAACGSSSAGSGSASKAAAAPKTVSGSCGTVPLAPYHDTSGQIKTLPASVKSDYSGFPDPIYASAYAHFKAPHGPPYKIGFLDNPVANAYNAALLANLKKWAAKLEAKGIVSQFIPYVDPTFDVSTQIQQFRSLIQQKVDAILVEPASGPALVPLAQQAHAAGIPTVTFFGAIDSPDAVNLGINPYLNAALPVAQIVKAMGGKGNFLSVRGAPTQPTDVAGYKGVQAVLSKCPNIKVVGQVVGQYENSVAKSVVQQFLTSHPAQINGVFDGGTMAQGVLSAFQQLGRPVPALTNLGGMDSVLGYWLAHPSFQSAATATGAINGTRAWLNVALRVLEGKGPKVNDLILRPPLITRANLSQWASKSVDTPNNPNSAEGPPDSLAPNSLLDNWFSKPGSGAPGIL